MTADARHVSVLVAAGRHPVSGRPMAAPGDAGAVGLALALAPERLDVVHAGDPAEPALAEYLGLGAAAVTVLRLDAGADPVPALVAYLRRTNPDLVLTGTRAFAGEDSGMVPYMVAEALDRPMVAGVVAGALVGDRLRADMAVPGGGRQSVAAPLPALAAVDPTAPRLGGYAAARARRGRVEIEDADAPRDAAPEAWRVRPAARRRRRLAAVAGSAEARMAALLETPDSGARALTGLDPESAARRILDYLGAEGLIGR